jgi:hypothetical protein
MKTRAILASTAMIFASFVPVLNGSALAAVTVTTPTADPADSTTLAEMQTQCDALAALHNTNNGDEWTGEIVEGDVTLFSGPTEVGTHSIGDAIDDPIGSGTFTPESLSILGDPYRNGGSVNMFGVLQSTGGHYSASIYDFEGDFTTTFAHAFSCDIFQAVFHEEQTIHHPAEGIYVINGDFGDSEDAVRGNCAAFTAQGQDPTDLPDWWGEAFHGGSDDKPHCKFEGTPAEDEVIPESFDDPVLVGNEAGTPVNQEQTDTLIAHEDAGEGFDIGETVLIGQAVICISPSTTTKKGVPGAWRTQNGYTGDKCTTAWFNIAPWGHGSQDSNGTYISVPLS